MSVEPLMGAAAEFSRANMEHSLAAVKVDRLVRELKAATDDLDAATAARQEALAALFAADPDGYSV